MKKEYKKKEWNDFRNSIIELDGFQCRACGRKEPEVVLQVHHKRYVKDKKPWEYATSDCITLCKGCHAQEHGIIPPKYGWQYVGEEDLEDLVGTCQNCGSAIRYVFYIYHEQWGTWEVGTICCNNLTDTQIASTLLESKKSYERRLKNFISSTKWKLIGDSIYEIKHSGFSIRITDEENIFYISVNQEKSKKQYKTLDDAKSRCFLIIESGELKEFFEKRNKKT
jgi:hypothetical protein